MANSMEAHFREALTEISNICKLPGSPNLCTDVVEAVRRLKKDADLGALVRRMPRAHLDLYSGTFPKEHWTVKASPKGIPGDDYVVGRGDTPEEALRGGLEKRKEAVDLPASTDFQTFLDIFARIGNTPPPDSVVVPLTPQGKIDVDLIFNRLAERLHTTVENLAEWRSSFERQFAHFL